MSQHLKMENGFDEILLLNEICLFVDLSYLGSNKHATQKRVTIAS